MTKYCLSLYPQYRGVEQLAARWAHNPKVTGSSPVPATKTKRITRVVLFFHVLTLNIYLIVSNISEHHLKPPLYSLNPSPL